MCPSPSVLSTTSSELAFAPFTQPKRFNLHFSRSTIAVEDVEKAAPDINTVHTSSTATIHVNDPEQVIVSWDGPEDPENPRNWSNHRRWTVTVVVSFFTFISPVASSISSPSLSAISADWGSSQPLFWGPLSELCGRFLVLQVSNIWFLVFNTICAFAKTPTQLLVGPSTGPLVGGWIAQKSDWHWVFWSVSIADAILQIAAFMCLRETYAPEILKRKARFVRKSTNNVNVRSVFEDSNRSWTTVMRRGMVKPIVFLATEPIVQAFALYMAVLYGVLYLSLTTFVKVLTIQYNEGPGIAGIHYLAIALGSTVGGQLGARILTRVYLYLKAKNGGIGVPEMRLPLLMVSAATLPIGLLIYGWSVQAHAFWLVPDLGVFVFSIGIGANWTCIQTYLVDSYAIYAASAIAAVSSFRAFAGFGFPLFADEIYARLGDGWGNSILALICLVIGCPAPFVFYRYGARLRSGSKGSSIEQ
ncbi:MFS general substrate transporter [Mycena olivaceomarginata]|nr:MFS general substrate transporter [Mycena olivaceomarginata]